MSRTLAHPHVPRAAPLALALLAAAGCGPRPAPAPAAPAPAIDLAALTIPVGPGTEAMLARLADEGDAESTWERTLYLLELFDDARFRRDERSLAVLRSATGAATQGDGHGAAATIATLAWLDAAAAALTPGSMRTGDLEAMRTVVHFDQAPPTRPTEVAARLAELAAVAHSGGAIASAARLRLAGWCRRALEDALAVPAAERPAHAAHCLWALTRIDALPWIGGAPPTVPWDAIAQGVGEVLDPVVHGAGRLAAAAASESRTLHDLIDVVSAAP